MPGEIAHLASSKRLFWSLLDQVVYGASNILVVSQFARSASVPELAHISAAYATVTIAIAVTRGALSEVIISSNDTYDGHDRVNANARVILFLLLAPIAVLLGGVLLFDISTPTIMLAGIPLLVVQDRLRFEWIQAGETSRALWLDTTWLAGQVALLLAAGSLISPPSDVAASCWLGGCACSLLFAKRVRTPYRISDARRWIVENRSPVLLTVGQVAAVMVAAQTPVFVFGLTGNPVAAAGYLAAAQALSPQTAMLIAFRPLVLRNLALQRQTLSSRLVLRASLTQAVPLLVGGIAVGWLALALLGEKFYGDQVSNAAMEIVWWLACTRALGALSLVFVGLLRVAGQWRSVLHGELLTSLILGGLPILVVQVSRQPGAIAAAQAVGALLSVAIWWRVTHTRSARYRS